MNSFYLLADYELKQTSARGNVDALVIASPATAAVTDELETSRFKALLKEGGIYNPDHSIIMEIVFNHQKPLQQVVSLGGEACVALYNHILELPKT
ncbi:hypothetical protein HK098_003682 [Nowakowskiella sp. JEL0407]|nr:hypothetical protein HK098_003682 [Nowakowskiella sp. JEL0407]